MEDVSKKLSDLSPEAKRALLAQLLRERAKANESREWLPISHNQKALWFLYRLAPQSAAYNLLYAARVHSRLDRGALERATQALAQRYPILTASYNMHDGEPMQRLHKERELSIEVQDATGWELDEIKQQLFQESNRPINLEQGPAMRVLLYQRADNDAVLALITHHIAVDFWALDILVDEIYLLYAAERVGLASPLPAPGPDNAAYVRWQNSMLASSEGEQHWQYWQKTLSGELPLLNLPTDRPRPPTQTYEGASYSFAIADELTQQLRTLASREKVTLFTLMLAAYLALLFRYTNQEDIIVGTPALGRGRADWERVVGYLANPVMIRANLTGNPTFKDLLAQARQGTFEALEHQDFPFPQLVERLHPRRDPSYSPIFQSLFIWDRPRKRDAGALAGLNGQDVLAQVIAREGLQLEPFTYGQQGAQNDLTLTVFEIEGALTGDFHYNSALFDAATLVQMERHFKVLLAGIVANPDQHLLELPLLTDAERQQILIQWNDTTRPYSDQASLHQLIEAQVKRTPDNIALVYENRTRSYRELNNEANQLAHLLRARGIGAETLVGVCMERSLEMVVALLAIIKAGGAYVPLDPTYPPERLAYMIEDAQVPILLTQSNLREQLPQTGVQVINIDPNWNAAITGNEKNLVNVARPDSPVYMIYTSGSTGKPKGVVNIHRAVVNRLYWMQQEYQLTGTDRVVQKTPFSFDVSAWEFFWPLLTGAGLVIAKPGGHQDPGYLVSLIARQRVTTVHFVPSMLQAFLLEPDLEEKCASLKRVICSGEALTSEHRNRFFARFSAPTQLYNLYGPTEAAIDVTHWTCSRADTLPVVPIGRPIANTQIYILNPAMQPVPVGVPGELYIGGVGLARGYHRRPELTTEKFVRDPFRSQAGARLFKTADLARYRPDGAIEFLGRIDHQVKIRGFRVELGEIEAELSQHPALKEVVVVAREDTPGNKRLVAYLIADPGARHPSVEDLRSYLKEKLPSYMVPASFLYLEEMPLSPNGKVERKALPAPTTARPELEADYVAPSNPVEQKLAEIWSDILSIDRIGIHDNYFDLGGASLQSLEVISRATEAGIPLVLEMLFEFQTIAELAAVVAEKQASSEEKTAPVVAEALSIAQAASENGREPEKPVLQRIVPMVRTQAELDLGNMYIESLGAYLPPKIVSSDEIINNTVKPLRFPMARLVGIKNRRMAGETEFSFELARNAIADCLANSKYNPEDIDLLLSCSISRGLKDIQFQFEPSMAMELKRHFGFTNAIAFDVSNACTTMFTGMYIAEAYLKAGLARRAMIFSGEYISHLITTAQKEIDGFMDSRLACLTVADAGSALILELAPDKKVGFQEFEMYTLGRYSEACIGKVTDREHGGAIMYTDAVQVSAVNMKQAISHAGHIIDRAKLPYNSFQHIIVHQTSKTTIQDVANAFNRYFGAEVCKQETVIDNIVERGNTATTTHMIALMDHIRNGTIQTGQSLLFGITGSGATIGTAIYTLDGLPDRIRRREAGEWTPEKVQSVSERFVPRLPATKRVRVASIGTVPLAGAGIEKTTLDLIRIAAERCLESSSYQKGDVDLLIYSGVYRDEFLCEPAVAALVEGMLGINDDIDTQQEKKTFALDIFNSGVGTLNACYASSVMIRAGKGKNALVVTSEVENNRDLSPSPLIGVEETGSALLLDESPDGMSGFGQFVFKHFPEYQEALRTRSETWNGKTRLHIQKDLRLEEYYLHCIGETVQELLDQEQLTLDQVCVILPPQISSEFISGLSELLEVSRDKLVDVHAARDLFTSSLAYTLQQVQEQKLAQPGDVALIINVGSGIQVGCATYYF
jgi:amino acid adenylation domain-containing protein